MKKIRVSKLEFSENMRVPCFINSDMNKVLLHEEQLTSYKTAFIARFNDLLFSIDKGYQNKFSAAYRSNFTIWQHAGDLGKSESLKR